VIWEDPFIPHPPFIGPMPEPQGVDF
jgi:hypothetical protein